MLLDEDIVTNITCGNKTYGKVWTNERQNLRLVLAGAFSFIAVVGFTANTLVCLAYYFRVSLRVDNSNKFLVSLALADLLNGLIVIPLLIGGMFFPSVNPYFLAFATILLLATVTNVCVITWDRYQKIFSPLAIYLKKTHGARLKVIFLCVWIIPIPVGLSTFLVSKLIGRESNIYKITVGLFDGVFTLLSMLIIYTYFLLLRQAARHASHIHKQRLSVEKNDESFNSTKNRKSKLHSTASSASVLAAALRDRKALKVCTLVVSTFLVCWFPTIVYDLLVLAGRHDKQADVFTLLLAFCNTVLDPLIYSIYKPDIRHAVKKIIFETSIWNGARAMTFRLRKLSSFSASQSSNE